MAVHTIPDSACQKFTSATGRKELMQEYFGFFSGKNADDETVQLSIDPYMMELTTFQSNGWVRVNFYDAEGLPCGETFNGKWR